MSSGTRSTRPCPLRCIRSAGTRRRAGRRCRWSRRWPLAIVAQAVLRAALTYAYNMITARLTQGEIVPELRAQLYAKLQRLSFSFFDIHGSNSIFNRVTGDVQNTRLFVDGVLLQGATHAPDTGSLRGLHVAHPAGADVSCLCVSVPLWWLAHFYSARLRPGYLRNRELTDNMVLLFSESVRGMQTVKGFASEPHQVRRFEEANNLVSSQQRKIFWNLSVFTPGTQLLSQLSLVILFAYGGWLYVQDGFRWAAGWWCSRGCSNSSRGRWRRSRPSPTRCSRAWRRRGGCSR